MIRFFKSTQPAALFAIPLIVILLWAERFSSFPVTKDHYPMPLWNLFESFFVMIPNWLSLLLFIAIISFEAIYFNLIVNRHEVLYKNSYLPSLFFVLFISSIPDFLAIHPIHFVNLILLRIFDKVFSLHKNNRAIVAIFDCGFLAATAALFYFPAIPILLLLMFTLSIVRPFHIREWLVLIIGYTIPFLFLSVFKFWNHELPIFWQGFFEKLSEKTPSFTFPDILPLQVIAGLLILMLILAWLRLRANYYKNIIRIRTYQQLLFFTFFLGILSVYLSRNMALINFAIFAMPVSIWYSYFFVSQKKKLWITEGLLWIFIGTIIWNHLT
ncbi:MAG TPA: DUF6427 family protein [Bacteroidia bacterium]|nr:DUF6427 family protein [Bacteroidia bacterium]